jgi:hypothetical protein
LIGQANHSVGRIPQLVETVFGDLAPVRTFAIERSHCKRNGKRTTLFGGAGEDRSNAGAPHHRPNQQQ